MKPSTDVLMEKISMDRDQRPRHARRRQRRAAGGASGLRAGELLGGGRLVLADRRAVAGGVDDVLLEERVAPVEDLLRDLEVRVVVVVEELVEEHVRAAAGLAAEQRGQLERLLALAGRLL